MLSTQTDIVSETESPATEEVVYSPEVMNDAELKKLLGEIGHKITEGINKRPDPVATVTPSHSSSWSIPQWIAVIGGSVAIVASLLAGLNFVIASSITSALVQTGKDLTVITEQGKALRRDVDRIVDNSARNVLQASPTKPVKDAANEIKDAATWARQRQLAIDPSIIRTASLPLLKSSQNEAWNATMSLLNLRSSVNTTLEYAQKHIVAVVKAGEKHIIPPKPPGGWVELDGGTVILDGQPGENGGLSDLQTRTPIKQLNNLIVKNALVKYHGGAIILSDVFFDNCTFEIDNNINGHNLAEAILALSPETSFAGN